jgi:hypothetical protein
MGMDRFSNLILRTTTRVFNVDDKNFVTYIPRKGSRFKIQAIFDNAFEQVDAASDNVIASNQPAIGIRLCDLPDEPHKDEQVIVKNIKYNIIDSQEDGHGGSTLFLQKEPTE